MKIPNPLPLVFLLVLLVAPGLTAQDRPASVVLPWGQAQGQLGVYRDGDYLRGPAFFDFAPDGTLWVADAYKERVARYSPQGRYLGEVLLPEVSPRMTAFRVVENGTMVLSNDQSLSRWTPEGEPVGRWGLGLVLPEAYWFTSDRAAVVLQTDSGWYSQEWDKTFETHTRFSLSSPAGSKAALKDGQGTIRMAFWKDQAAVFGWKALVDAEALLVRGGDGETVWSSVKDGQRHFWRVDPAGGLKGRASVPATPGAPGLFAFGPGLLLLWGQWSDQGLVLNTAPWGR